MEADIKIDDTIYKVPLTKNPLSNLTDSFTTEADFLSESLPSDKPGTLTINDVQYNAYKGSQVVSNVPETSSSMTSYNAHDNQVDTYSTSYSTSPVTFSSTETASLVKILKKLATYSHTHSSSSTGWSGNPDVTVERNTWDCVHHGNCQVHSYRADNCDSSGTW